MYNPVLHIIVFYIVQFKNSYTCYLFCALKMFNRFLNRAFIKKFQNNTAVFFTIKKKTII